jgi:glycosyl transferase family 25
MASKIDKVFYINLDRRSDRRDLIEMDLGKIGLAAERFVGIPYEPGIVGCGKSHLAVMKMAKERGYKNVLILEDDFTFLVSKEELDVALDKFFSNVKEYDVCMLSCQNMVEVPTRPHPFLSRLVEANNASAYIINGDYLDKLIELYERALPLLERTGEHWNYANDQVWKILQRKDRWFCFNPRLGKQRSGYSDNAKAFMDYEK